MKTLKTSTQIALKFTIYFAIIFSVLGVISNGIFFKQRTSNEYARIQGNNKPIRPLVHKGIGGRFQEMSSPIVILEYGEDIVEDLKKNTITANISEIDGLYIMYIIGDKQIKIMDISRPMEMQHSLFWTTLLIIVGGTVITFGLSRRFTKSSLKKVNELVQYAQQLDIHNLMQPVPISGPKDDEIRIIAQAFQNSLNVIKDQTDSLKDFVSYASHELKTPLSTIRGLIDLGLKTKDIEKTGTKIKKTLTEMSDLLDTLLTITKREFSDITTEKIDIIPLMLQVGNTIAEQYKHKNINYKVTMPTHYIVQGKTEIIKIILSNLLNNAYKFTSEQGTIGLSLKNNTIIITDDGIGISPQDQEKIRIRFWKKSTENNNGYGLGLYMVKLLSEKLGRSINVESKETEGTSFIITIK